MPSSPESTQQPEKPDEQATPSTAASDAHLPHRAEMKETPDVDKLALFINMALSRARAGRAD